MWPVLYPACFTNSAMVISSVCRCIFWEGWIQEYTPARNEKRPVSSAAREGEHTAEAA